jgi:O-antigen ligase
MPSPIPARGNRPISAREWTLLALLCLQCTLATWAMALTHLTTQIICAGMACTGMLITLLPVRSETQAPADRPKSQRTSLWHFPPFWAGLAVLTYTTLQGLNPAYGYAEADGNWKAFPINHLNWLPSSVASPFTRWDSWRLLLMLGSTWMTLCYAWKSIRKQRLIRVLLWSINLQCLLFCLLALIQKQSEAKGIYWTWEVFPNFFGTAPYKNRGATLLYLMMAISMAHYWIETRHSRARGKPSGLHLMVLISILIQYATLWSSYSRGGIAVGSALMATFVLTLLMDLRSDHHSNTVKVSALAFGVLLLAASTILIPRIPDFQISITHFGRTEKHLQNLDLNGRGPVTQVCLDMAARKPWYGWGAASWRYVFPYFQRHHPKLMYMGNTRLVWDDAHNDWAQYLVEYGIIGSAMLLACALAPLMHLAQRLRRSRPEHWICAIALAGLITHALIELLLQNQAILTLSALLAFLIYRIPYRSTP